MEKAVSTAAIMDRLENLVVRRFIFLASIAKVTFHGRTQKAAEPAASGGLSSRVDHERLRDPAHLGVLGALMPRLTRSFTSTR
jgi:hypothetical protein